MTAAPIFAQHERRFAQWRFVYPVISRRSGGVSLGINLNPDKACNFDCIYCQVDRKIESDTKFVDLERLEEELEQAISAWKSGDLFQTKKFVDTPAPLRRLNDFAFSGDGEPTTYRNFDEILERCAGIKRGADLSDVKMVLITNASRFHRPHVRRGLEILDANQGEIWGKLDAGTEEYFRLVDRTTIRFSLILENLLSAARVRPIVIQSLFMNVNRVPPSGAEIDAFCDRLNEIVQAGGQISLVQVYTIARRPAESYVTPLSDREVDAIRDRVKSDVGLRAESYYGVSTDSDSCEETVPEIAATTTLKKEGARDCV